jgi:hypothetical protein
MDKRTNRQHPPPDELVSQYRDIGIPAVAAAARYQSRDRAGTRPRRPKGSQENPPARDNNNENVGARRRSVATK